MSADRQGLDGDESALLAHYLERGREPWNGSTEAAWLDYMLRAYVQPRIPSRRPLAACNIGIGVGLWDDWLGHVAACSITSVDRDPDICQTFALRQRREEHPYPARVVCGDVLHGVLGGARFDLITCIGSTLAESGDAPQLQQTLQAALAPGGRLVTAQVVAGSQGSIALVLTSTDAAGRSMEPGMKAELTRCACTRINDPWRRFCGGCGTHLQPSCTCGFVNARSDAFCGGCGVRMTVAATPGEGTTIPLDIIEVIS